MRELVIEIFSSNMLLVIILHVLSAIVWIGGMVAIRFAVHPAMQHISEPNIKLARILEILKNFFNIVGVFIVLLLITALIMSLAVDYQSSGLGLFIHIKEGIWTLMTIIFIYITKKRDNAQNAFLKSDFALAKRELEPIAKYFIPINIILGIFALALGVTLRV